jgi:hypothetical protein
MTTTNIEIAQRLLASSYVLGARRISEALASVLPIRNSREPLKPPAYPGKVVGLCGQSGRHPYFRIRASDLQTAVAAILQAGARPQNAGSATNSLVNNISNACRQLRSVTVFDASTGCVNDSLPSMVPLLPPEEIWLDGCEMPLDIWRLVSLEFDLVSSAVSSQVPVEDFAFSAVTPGALAFRAMINQLGTRRTEFRVLPKNIPSQCRSLLPSSRQLTPSLARVYFEAGCLLTPLAADQYVKWYSAVRYLHWIDAAKRELRVGDRFKADTIDSRYRGLFAEETAVGLMAIVLTDLFGVVRINNTVEINPSLAGSRQPIADFVAEAIQGSSAQRVTILAESKGSLGTKVSKQRRDRAKEQVTKTSALVPGSSAILRMTFCSNVWFSGDSGPTECVVDDPPEDERTTTIEIDPVLAWRMAYAKAFRFVGLDAVANQVIEGDGASVPTMRPAEERVDRDEAGQAARRRRRFASAQELFGVELMIDAGECGVALDRGVGELVRHGINSNTIPKLEDTVRRRTQFQFADRASFVTALGFGCVFYNDIE